MYGRRRDNRDIDPRDGRKGGLVRMGIRGIAGGIGLASESIKAHKESKAAKKEGQTSGSTSQTDPDGGITLPPGPGNFGDAPPSYEQVDSATSSAQATVGDEKKPLPQSPDEEFGPPEDNTQEQWDLDEAQDQVTADSGEVVDKPTTKSARELEEEFLKAHPPPQSIGGPPGGQLSLPVVLPQRRPKDRSRGFIRAYAPVLENVGIDQAQWLNFLDIFQKSSAADPWISAINMAQFATIAIPHGIGIAVGIVIQQITNVAIEMQSRERTSHFLYKMNEEYFRPRGLYCLVMTYNKNSTAQVEPVNLTATIASRSDPATGLAGVQNTFRTADGVTRNEWEFPECAPLIFPGLDQLGGETSSSAVKEQTKIKKTMGFVTEYWDKRATASYAMANPNTPLAQVPQGEFKSRYADPKNPAASGSLISLVSGGKLVPGPGSRGLIGGMASVIGQAVRGEKQGSEWNMAARNYEYTAQHYPGFEHAMYTSQYCGRGRRYDRGRLGLISTPVGAVKKLLKSNVLYLMVVNMPSNEEMAEAQATYGRV